MTDTLFEQGKPAGLNGCPQSRRVLSSSFPIAALYKHNVEPDEEEEEGQTGGG